MSSLRKTTAYKLLQAVREAAGRTVPAELRPPEAPGGHTPYTVAASEGPMRVLYYPPTGGSKQKTPIVFVYSLINRWYILDFLPGRSLLEYLTGQGHPCYAVDWGWPGEAERTKTMGDYVVRYIDVAMRTACEREGVEQATLYGYCMGGTMALAYAALRPARIKNVVAMAVPVDFHDSGLLSLWTRSKFFNVDALVDAYGNVPTWLMESGFRMLNPVSNVSKWRDLWKNRDRDGFVDVWRALEHWSSDNVPFPGEVYRQYVRDCYQNNVFHKSEMVIDGERVDLRSIEKPLLCITAKNDHIVPGTSATCLMDIVGSEDKTLFDFPTGHIGLSTSSKSPKKYWPEIHSWLAAHGEGAQHIEPIDHVEAAEHEQEAAL